MDLIGTEWRVEEIASRGVLDDVHPTIRFGDDGRVSGSTGVNRFTGTYELDGEQLTVGPLATTRMAGPPAAMDQEQRFLAVLGQPSLVVDEATWIILRQRTTSTRLVPVEGSDDERLQVPR